MSNLVAENTAILIGLALKFRPKIWVVLEQPKGSQMWKLPLFQSLIAQCGLFFVLTYLGLWGMDILKGCHLCTNLGQVKYLARKATRDVKGQFQERVDKKIERLRMIGKAPKVYYTTGISKKTGKKTFTGGKHLQDTALYPIRFCNALFQCWLRAHRQAIASVQQRFPSVEVVLDWPVQNTLGSENRSSAASGWEKERLVSNEKSLQISMNWLLQIVRLLHYGWQAHVLVRCCSYRCRLLILNQTTTTRNRRTRE